MDLLYISQETILRNLIGLERNPIRTFCSLNLLPQICRASYNEGTKEEIMTYQNITLQIVDGHTRPTSRELSHSIFIERQVNDF